MEEPPLIAEALLFVVEELERLCRLSIDADQQVLEPLLVLRGVGRVEVKGRVTDGWKRFLKGAMESGVGSEIGRFDHPETARAPWVKASKKSRKSKRGHVDRTVGKGMG